MIPFQQRYADLPEQFHERVAPAGSPDPTLLALNGALATELGLDPEFLRSDGGLAILSGKTIPDGSIPIAQAYAGHQFGGWVPQLGDGRAILLGEIETPTGELFDFQLKGSGRTPFSRGGDGKAALGPVIREYLVSEAMAALGVPTTRALAAVRTGEMVRRETELPGGIITRIASSHIRVGTFQFFLARGDFDAIRTLADHVIARHYPEAARADLPALALLESVVTAQASLIAHWMSLGFIHGVMNTDNCSIAGETIDYGPCAFIDRFHPEKVFSSIDRNGRYAWSNQPAIGHWNLTRLAETLLPLIDDDPEKAKGLATVALDQFSVQFESAFQSRMLAKLGLEANTEDSDFVGKTIQLLAEEEVDFTLFFRRLTQGQTDAVTELFTHSEPVAQWLGEWRDSNPDKTLMKTVNPILIPRNHRVEEAIAAAYEGNFALFERLIEAFAKPFEERPEFADLENPPEPHEVVTETFCGT